LRKLNYDPLKSFEPICYLASVPSVIVVNSALPYRLLADLFAAARAKPGALTLASVGPASVFDISAEMLKRAVHVNMTYVPYPGGAPVLNALLGEHVTSALATYSTSAEQLKAGKLRALAAATRTRIEPLPDVPTVAESGFEDFEVDFWLGVFAPAQTPKAMVSGLAGWFQAALRRPRSRRGLSSRGSIRSAGAARISQLCSASNMTTTAASFANRASRRSEAARDDTFDEGMGWI
jgi:tripartite-type tricarboxylate transporter receptor subunit TctC